MLVCIDNIHMTWKFSWYAHHVVNTECRKAPTLGIVVLVLNIVAKTFVYPVVMQSLNVIRDPVLNGQRVPNAH